MRNSQHRETDNFSSPFEFEGIFTRAIDQQYEKGRPSPRTGVEFNIMKLMEEQSQEKNLHHLFDCLDMSTDGDSGASAQLSSKSDEDLSAPFEFKPKLTKVALCPDWKEKIQRQRKHLTEDLVSFLMPQSTSATSRTLSSFTALRPRFNSSDSVSGCFWPYREVNPISRLSSGEVSGLKPNQARENSERLFNVGSTKSERIFTRSKFPRKVGGKMIELILD